MLLRIAALAGLAFAGFKMYEKSRDDGAFGTADPHGGKDTWDTIDDADTPPPPA